MVIIRVDKTYLTQVDILALKNIIAIEVEIVGSSIVDSCSFSKKNQEIIDNDNNHGK